MGWGDNRFTEITNYNRRSVELPVTAWVKAQHKQTGQQALPAAKLAVHLLERTFVIAIQKPKQLCGQIIRKSARMAN
jgi:uncharacterized protein YktB (UPF0637 family)